MSPPTSLRHYFEEYTPRRNSSTMYRWEWVGEWHWLSLWTHRALGPRDRSGRGQTGCLLRSRSCMRARLRRAASISSRTQLQKYASRNGYLRMDRDPLSGGRSRSPPAVAKKAYVAQPALPSANRAHPAGWSNIRFLRWRSAVPASFSAVAPPVDRLPVRLSMQGRRWRPRRHGGHRADATAMLRNTSVFMTRPSMGRRGGRPHPCSPLKQMCLTVIHWMPFGKSR